MPTLITRGKDGWTALMLASLNGHQQVVELLLKQHADINTQNEGGWTALMIASLNGHHQIVELLVKEHADINTQNEGGWTGKMIAICYKHVEIAKSLLHLQADPYLSIHNRSTAFSLAVFGDYRDLINILLDKAQPTSDEIEKAVVESCLGGHCTLHYLPRK